MRWLWYVNRTTAAAGASAGSNPRRQSFRRQPFRLLTHRHRPQRDRPVEAMSIFRGAFPKYSVAPNVVSYNIAISACAKGRKFELALELFEEMQSSTELEPDARSYNALLHALDNCQEAELALDHLRQVTAAGAQLRAFASKCQLDPTSRANPHGLLFPCGRWRRTVCARTRSRTAAA
jgi:pentatricopeptide repeat protein